MFSCIFNYTQDTPVWQEENMRLKNGKEDMMEKGIWSNGGEYIYRGENAFCLTFIDQLCIIKIHTI